MLTGAELVRALTRAGFVTVSQRGSHVKLRRGELVVIVPVHRRELARGTLQSILRQAAWDAAELSRWL